MHILYFSWLCAWDGFTNCRFHIYPRTAGLCSFVTVQSNDVCKWSSTLWPDGCIRLLAHYTTPVSSLCRCICRYWISKILARYILSSGCLRLGRFSQLYFLQYMGLYVFGLPIFLMMVVRIRVVYIYTIINKFDPFAVVYGNVMKQWYTLYVFRYFYSYRNVYSSLRTMVNNDMF